MTKANFLALAFLVFIAGLYFLANAVTSGNRPPQPTPTPAPAMEWRVTDTTGETYTYPEAAGWGCVSGGTDGAVFFVSCRQWAGGREVERVEFMAVRLEYGAAAGGAE